MKNTEHLEEAWKAEGALWSPGKARQVPVLPDYILRARSGSTLPTQDPRQDWCCSECPHDERTLTKIVHFFVPAKSGHCVKLCLLWRRANARNVSQHTLYGVQHIYRRPYVDTLYTVLNSLSQLLEHERKWKWTNECEAFTKEELITSHLTLSHTAELGRKQEPQPNKNHSYI